MSTQSIPPYQNIVYDRVSCIPKGRVVTYGQIAQGLPGITARMAGRALAETPDNVVIPWHRVVNSQGKISHRGDGDNESIQRIMLEDEGIVFSAAGKINLKKFRWKPDWPGPVFTENRNDEW